MATTPSNYRVAFRFVSYLIGLRKFLVFGTHATFSSRVGVPHSKSSLPSPLENMSKLLSAFAILHSAVCRCICHTDGAQKVCKIYVGVAEAGLKRGQQNWARLAGRSRQNFRAVCPFSACLSPAGHETAAKKGLRATNFSFNWAIGTANPDVRPLQHATTPCVLHMPCHRLLEPLLLSFSLTLRRLFASPLPAYVLWISML